MVSLDLTVGYVEVTFGAKPLITIHAMSFLMGVIYLACDENSNFDTALD